MLLFVTCFRFLIIFFFFFVLGKQKTKWGMLIQRDTRRGCLTLYGVNAADPAVKCAGSFFLLLLGCGVAEIKDALFHSDFCGPSFTVRETICGRLLMLLLVLFLGFA